MTLKPEFRSQRGMGLIEALVTMALTVILGLGVAFLSGRAAVAQKEMNTLGLAVGQMRNVVFSGSCDGVSNGNGNGNNGNGNGNRNNTTLTLAGAGESAVTVGVNCRSRNTPLRITSTSEAFPASGNAAIPVRIPSVSTPDDEASRGLFGGQVIVGAGRQNGDD